MEEPGQAVLALEDGHVFAGQAFGATGRVEGEVVFNTSMTGYQEVLTDPSYRGQMVTMTYPLVGNYGVNPEDVEMLQDLIVAAVNEATRKSQDMVGEEMKKLTGGMSIPGLF